MTQANAKELAVGALVAAAAGLAAALLFVLASRGSLITIVLGNFAPMPVMIASLGFGLSIGAAAAAIGASFIAFVFHPLLGLLYLASIGGPAALIAAAALLAPVSEDGRSRDLAPTLAVVSAALIIALAVSIALVVVASSAGGFDALLAMAVKEGKPLIESILKGAHPPGAVDVERLTRFMAMAAPIGVAASQTFALIVNLWLAGRVSLISGQLPRPWPAVADNLVLPPVLGALFVAACGLAFVGGLPGVVSAVFAAAFGAAFALQGFAVVHVLTRGANVRPALLFTLYGLVALLPPWPFLLMALVGLVDAVFRLRARKSAASNPNV